VIRLMVVDDHPVASAGVIAALAEADDIEIVGVAGALAEVGPLVGSTHPDVILCDIQLGKERALDLPHQLPPPAPQVIFFTSYDYPSFVRAALDAGAAGFLLKTAPLTEIAAAIRSVAAGGTAYDSAHLRSARRVPRMPSGRELQVISLVATGSSNAEIGTALGIDERTVESHLRRLFDRYGADSRTELITFSVRAGWIDLAPNEPAGAG
jgi:DNA-binding NarL/FixJ family response regulator